MTLTDGVALAVMTALAISLLVRIFRSPRRTYRPLLWSQVLVLLLFATSLSWVYPVLDAALGGRNYLNLVAHLMFIAASWIYTKVVAAPFFADQPTPAPLQWWVPVVAALGATTFFFLMDADTTTSRGLDAFTDRPAWVGYWICNIMTAWLPAFVLVPRLWEAVKITKLKSLTVTYWSLIVGYATSVVAVMAYIVSYFVPAIVVGREILVLITALGIVVALIIIPISPHQKTAEYRTRHQAQAEAARRFQH